MNLLAPISGWLTKALKGLLAAAFGGAITVIAAVWADPAHICFTSDCLHLLVKEALAGALIAVLAYFKTPHRDPDNRTREDDTADDLMGDRRSSTGQSATYKGKGNVRLP